MTRSLRIVLACAIALLVIGMGGLAALMLIPSPPQTTKSMIGALGGPFTLTATDGRAVTEQTYRGQMGADLLRLHVVSRCLPHGAQQYGRRARPAWCRCRHVAAGLHNGMSWTPKMRRVAKVEPCP